MDASVRAPREGKRKAKGCTERKRRGQAKPYPRSMLTHLISFVAISVILFMIPNGSRIHIHINYYFRICMYIDVAHCSRRRNDIHHTAHREEEGF